jgi:flagellar hook assembly protein FlgD
LNRRILYLSFIFLVVSLWSLMTGAAGFLITNVQMSEFTFSPDGDGFEDSTFIYFTLSDTATTFSAVILSSDSLNLIDTLLSSAPKSAGTDTTVWDGRNLLGQIVPEGDYLLFLRAEGMSGTDSLYHILQVDLTVPQVMITSIQPSTIIAPGLNLPPLRVYFDLTDALPSDSVSTGCYILDTTGTKIDTLLFRYLETGAHSISWDGQSATVDGPHQILITAIDNASHTADDVAAIYVDLDPPVIEVTSFESSAKFKVIPDSIQGWAYDISSLTPLEMRFRTGVPYFEVPVRWWQNDTLFFAAPLADSILQDTVQVIRFRTSDLAGRSDSLLHRVEWDTTAGDPPVLDQPAGPVRSPNYLLTGSFNERPDRIWIYQNGSLVDSLLLNIIMEDISVEVLLEPGENQFYIIARDDAGNLSLPSNTITVVYNSQTGLFLPQPFRPRDEFQINTAQAMVRVRLKIYDLSGDLVRALDYTAAGTSFTAVWNGVNGEDESIHRGPLVVVAFIDFADGSTESIKEIFLFDP